MSDFTFQAVEHDGIACLLVRIDAIGPTEVYIPLDEIVREASWKGYALYNLSDVMLQKVCESQGYTNQDDITRRLDVLEQHFSEQGINDLAHAIELRIISRLRYGRDPRIEKAE